MKTAKAAEHVKETSVQLANTQEYTGKIVQTLDDTIRDTQELVQDAREAELYSTALNGMKILAGILETQAKILGIADSHAKKSNQTLHVHMSVPKEEVMKLAEDYKSTVDIEPSDG